MSTKPYAVTALVLAAIWLFAPRWPLPTWVVVGGILVVLLIQSKIPPSDLGWARFRETLRSWWWAYVLCVVVFAIVVVRGTLTQAMVTRGLVYFVWCAVQQLIYQYLVCRQSGQWASAALFSVVHLPNPVLVPATFVWGAASWSMFRRGRGRGRGLWAIALFQYLLSGILYALLPYAWHHGFRIGPGYLMVRSDSIGYSMALISAFLTNRR